MSSYKNLSDEELIEQAVEFVKYEQEIPKDLYEKLTELGIQHFFEKDTYEDVL